ncbi:MAG: thiamine pyrophosphate-dependent enzyme [Planctomycetaceae bacterium]
MSGPQSNSTIAHHDITNDIDWLMLYRLMRTAREIDIVEQRLVSSGHAFFHVSGAGHESTALLAPCLSCDDWLHLHYRDKALMLARGVTISEFFRGLICRNTSFLWTSDQLLLSCRHSKIIGFAGPVGCSSLQSCGVAATIKESKIAGIAVCSVGDGTTQEGEFLEAVAEAVRCQLPVLFVIADNGYSISTPTDKKTFYDLPTGAAEHFLGVPITRVDGRDVITAEPLVRQVVNHVRDEQRPGILILYVDRLDNHTNADDQSRYRSSTEIENIRQHGDPVCELRRDLIDSGFSESQLQDLEREIHLEVQSAVEDAFAEDEPAATSTAFAPYTREMLDRVEHRGNDGKRQLTMREAICDVLRHHLENDPRVSLYGQDIEDPKGDVFGVTRGLSSAFPGRVVNAPLSESTIVGTAIGRALSGQRPVGFIQFADFLPLAFNQIVSEMASMHWRTNGDWSCPVILMVTCGGYRPGLGPFHSQTMDGFAAHIPGVDVFMPSSAGDAAGLLNAAFQSPRPTIFLYPKSCLNLEDRTTSEDVESQYVLPGRARRLRTGSDLTLVTWGNPVRQCEAAGDVLEESGFTIDLIDLRTLSPWDQESVIASATRTGRLVVVHEDNHSGGFGAEVVATVAEETNGKVRSRRVTRPDTFVPFHYGNQLEVLPSFQRILQTCAELLDCDLSWTTPEADPPGQNIIRTLGSGPSDEIVDVVAILVAVGDRVEPGQTVAEIEATKSIVEITATVSGTVTEVLAVEGDQREVGAPLLRIEIDGSERAWLQPLTKENPDTPQLTRRRSTHPIHHLTSPSEVEHGVNEKLTIYGSRPCSVTGGKVVTSESLAAQIPDWTGDMVVKRTGVATRNWVTADQTPVSMAIAAAEQLLSTLSKDTPSIGAILCSVTGPQEASPSISCQVATQLHESPHLLPDHFAFDFNAACSGYLYGLRLARDFLRGNRDVSVLLLTSEVASPALDRADPVTAFLFGDAATATLITSAPSPGFPLQFEAPTCFSTPDPDIAIHLPCVGSGDCLRMDGIAVARAAYKAMAHAVHRAASEASLSVETLSALVPHPGSGRILKNVAEALEMSPDKVLTTLSETGNTSSSSIPLALDVHWNELPQNQPFGLTAFGAGFTSAAAIATKTGDTNDRP